MFAMQKMRVLVLLCAALAIAAPGRTQQIGSDKGKFVFTLQDNDAGSETFISGADGGTTYDAAIAVGATKLTGHTVIRMENGRPVQIDADYKPGGKLSLTLAGDKTTMTLDGKTRKAPKISAKVFLFDNFAPHILSPLLAAYDTKKGGIQNFDLLVVNSASPIAATLTRGETRSKKVGGAALDVTAYSIVVQGGVGSVELTVQADKDFRVLSLNIPGQKYLAVREGYAELTKAETPPDPTLSPPTFKVKKEENVRVKMRDGVELAADVYRPDALGTYPVILQRTPYSRKNATEAEFYVRRGYVFVAQDVRGKFDSAGAWEPWIHEARDGFDTIEWCAAQWWSNGKVGMIGASYLGFVQWAAAREGSEHLKCLIPIVSPPDPFFNIPYAYGPLYLYASLWWSAIVEGKTMQSPKVLTKLDAMKTLPLKNVDSKVFGHTIPFFQDWLKHSTNDAYWDQVNFNDRAATFRPIPALHVSGWFDGDGIGTRRNYAAMIAAGQGHQHLIYGPWEHGVNSSSKIGDRDFGPTAIIDLQTRYLRWFDHWLKGVDNGVDREPPVEAFLMGSNEWRRFSAWPPAEAETQKWYFHSGGKANGSGGDGRLSLDATSASETADHYDYNPAKPYIPGGLTKMTKDGKDDDSSDISADEKDRDKLVYTSDALASDVIVAGPIDLHLAAATSAKDTDWYAYFSDVAPDGKSVPMGQGIIRARFRKSFSKPELLVPNETADYDLALWAIGNVFKKGHKIRVVVTSSCFPLYDRNLNTGEDIASSTRMVTAHQTLYHNDAHRSYLVLPVLPK